MIEILKNMDWIEIVCTTFGFTVAVLIFEKIFTNKKDKK